jgi:hypothetical protein
MNLVAKGIEKGVEEIVGSIFKNVRVWRWLVSRFVYYTPLRRRYARDYYESLKAEFSTFSLLGRSAPLDLEQIYIALRMSQYKRPDLLSDPGRFGSGTLDDDLGRTRQLKEAMEIETILSRFTRLVILGDPGAGKTTLLKHLALRAAKGDQKLFDVIVRQKRRRRRVVSFIPIFLTLNDLARDGHDLVEGMVASLARHGFPHSRLFVKRALARGRCLCLLDGLDEVVDDRAHERLVREIDVLATIHAGNLVIVTSRVAGFHHLFRSGFTLLEVVQFDREQIRLFLESWFATQPERAKGLHSALAESPRMRLLAANPLLLSIIALIYELDTRLPERRVELYERCVWVLLEEWERLKGLTKKRRFPPDIMLNALEALSLRFQQGKHVALDMDKLQEYLGEIFPEPDKTKAFLDEVLQRTGLLRQMSRSSYAFTHLTIQEFLTAQAIKRYRDHAFVLDHIDDPWWWETIILLAGLERDATILITEILAARPVSLEALLLTVRCLTDADKTEPRLRTEVVERMVRWLKTTSDYRIVRGVEDLADALGEHAWVELTSLLHEPDPSLRARIAKLLGAIGTVRAIPLLIDTTLHDEIPHVRVMAAVGLGEIGGSEVTLPLIKGNYSAMKRGTKVIDAEKHVAGLREH